MQVNRSGISNLTGLAGAANIQGEDQKKLDVVSNTVFCNALRASGRTVRHPSTPHWPRLQCSPGLSRWLICSAPGSHAQCSHVMGQCLVLVGCQ